jgi:hypothetical protein
MFGWWRRATAWASAWKCSSSCASSTGSIEIIFKATIRFNFSCFAL